jgi:polysaccharide export outer membrane protein
VYAPQAIVSVDVRKVNSRMVFVAGEVRKPGPYPLINKTNVMQMLVIAGGLTEYANKGNIAIIRTEKDGSINTYRMNYTDVRNGKNAKQNIELKVGDIIEVSD